MAKKKSSKKKITPKPSSSKTNATAKQEVLAKKIAPTVSKVSSSKQAAAGTLDKGLLYQKRHFMIMLLGAAFVFLGMLMMIGGDMPDPNTWDPSIIYSKRITVLGPILILTGLGIEIYAIFKR